MTSKCWSCSQLVLQSFAFAVYKLLQSTWQLPTQTVDVMVIINVLHYLLQSSSELWHCLCPQSRHSRGRFLLSDPRDTRLTQSFEKALRAHNFENIALRARGRFAPEGRGRILESSPLLVLTGFVGVGGKLNHHS